MIKYLLCVLSCLILTSCTLMSALQNSSAEKFVVNSVWAQSNLQFTNNQFRKINRMSPVVFEDKLIIVGDSISGLVAYDLNNKSKVWSLKIPLGIEASVLDFEDRLYVGSLNGKFYSINLKNGEIIWEFDTKSEIVAEALLYKGNLYFVNGSQSLYALDAASGKQKWVYSRQDTSSTMTIRGGSKPSVANGSIFAGFSDGSLVAISEISGAQIWELQLNRNSKFSDIDSSPVVSGENIYVNSFDDKVYCVSIKDGSLVWQSEISGGISSPVVDGEVLYLASSKGQLYSLEKKTGKVIWQLETKKGIFTEPVVNEEILAVGESQGKLLFLSKSQGKRIGSFEPGRGVFSKPTYYNHRYYFISGEANIYGIEAGYTLDNNFKFIK